MTNYLIKFLRLGNTSQCASLVTIIDANNPAELLNSFGVCSGHVMCISSVPGASLSDYEDAAPRIEYNSEIINKCDPENVNAVQSDGPNEEKKESHEKEVDGNPSGDKNEDSSSSTEVTGSPVVGNKQSTRNHEEMEEAALVSKTHYF